MRKHRPRYYFILEDKIMKLNELVSLAYGTLFPPHLTRTAVEYYLDGHAKGPGCAFFLEDMVKRNDFTLSLDELHYLKYDAPRAFPDLYEAFLYAAYQGAKQFRPMPIARLHD